MIPAFIIHSSSCKERHDIVKQLQHQTNASIIDAIVLPNGNEGCTVSHIAIAELAKQLYPDQAYLVFEDDCVLVDTWKEALHSPGDITYIGYTNSNKSTLFGTHALLISPKARDIIITKTRQHAHDVQVVWAFDWIVSFLCKTYDLTIAKPSYDDRNKYCFQKTGLISQITKKKRL